MNPARWLAVMAVSVFVAAAAAAATVPGQVRAWRVAHEQEIAAEYLKFVAIPNIAADPAGQRRTADFIVGMMQARGIANARLIAAPTPGVPPVVFGEVTTPGAARTIMFYAHYDGMPVNAAQWAAGWSPFIPRFVTDTAERGGKLVDWKPGAPIDPEWRITGRGSADDKAGVQAILNAYAALKESGTALAANVKFFFEGEEEAGSPHMREFLTSNRDLFRADLWVIADGPCHVSGRKLVVLGVRGDVNVALTVYGPKRPLHSGHYGNWAPNPAGLLVNLLASMKDNEGRVLIKGFYDDVAPLSDAERRALAAMPVVDADLAHELGIARPEVPGRSLLESIMLPSLNINGLAAANVGAGAANVIPTTAQAVLDLRLVPGNDVPRQIAKVVAHIEAQGFHVLDREPTDTDRATFARLIRVEPKPGGYNAQRTPVDSPVARAVAAAVQSTSAEPIVVQPMMGGSVALSVIEDTMGTKLVIVPVVNADNNQHAENENVKVQFLWSGIETYAALMTMR